MGLRLGDAAKALCVDSKQALDDYRLEPLRYLEFHRRNYRELIFTDIVLGPWLGVAECLPDHHEKLERDAAPIAQLLECGGGEPGEPIERTDVQVRERESSLPDCRGDTFERDSGQLEIVNPARPADITR